MAALINKKADQAPVQISAISVIGGLVAVTVGAVAIGLLKLGGVIPGDAAPLPTAVKPPLVKPVAADLEASAKKLAHAWVAAKADGVAVDTPSGLLGQYLLALPPSPAPTYWQMTGYALKAPVTAEFCQAAFNHPPAPAEQPGAGLQCHHAAAGVMLTYRLDAVRPVDKGYYPVTVTMANKGNVPWVGLSVGEFTASCAEQLAAEATWRPAQGELTQTYCLAAFSWEALEHMEGTIVLDQREQLELQFRGGGYHQTLAVTATPNPEHTAIKLTTSLSKI